MEQKAKKSTSSKTKKASKEAHTADKRRANAKALQQAPDLVATNTVTAGTYNAPGASEDMAVLSASQEAQAFDMSNSTTPETDRSAALDARTQGALQPVGTQAATEPIITEDGVIVPNA